MSECKNRLPRLLAVVGPTAGGKTALSLALGRHLGGEIVSCDSMQIYRGMDIGTAKATVAERAALPHHLLDIRNVNESYSCAEYQADAQAIIQDITARGKTPIVCGGTGLYLDALLLGGSFEATPSDPAVRERLFAMASEPGGADRLYARLCEIDPESAAATHKNNVKRVMRALEIFEACGTPKSVLDRASRERGLRYDATVFGLRYHSRETLYCRIDTRVDQMMQEGLWEETKRLYNAGVFDINATAAQAIGYKELLAALRGECAISDAVAQLKLSTRHYAKRQLTWFSSKPYITWLYADTEDGEMREKEDVLADALSCLARHDAGEVPV